MAITCFCIVRNMKQANQFNAEHLRVEYKVLGRHNINDFLDKRIEKIANACGLEFWGSGYDFRTKIRDLEFGSKLIED